MKSSPSPRAFEEAVDAINALLSDALKNLSSTLQSASGTLRSLSKPRRKHTQCPCGCEVSDDCGCFCGCRIPETCCPPRCVCEMRLAAMTGQTVVAGLRVVNSSSENRTFTISSQPFYFGQEQATFQFKQTSLTLGPGASGFTTGSLTIPVTFAKGTYETEITVTGAYEQCVKAILDVGCDEHQSATCEVVECERRERIRAHHWYDHFQCVEPCGTATLQR